MWPWCEPWVLGSGRIVGAFEVARAQNLVKLAAVTHWPFAT